MTERQPIEGRDRRRHERYPLRAPVDLIWGKRRLSGTLRDISIGGAAVKVRAAVGVGSEVTLEMGDLGTFAAVVVRAVEDSTIAVRFVIDETEAAALGTKLVTVFHGAEAPQEPSEPDVEKHPLVM